MDSGRDAAVRLPAEHSKRGTARVFGMMKLLLLALGLGVLIQAVSRDPGLAEQYLDLPPIVVEVASGVFTIFIAVLLGAYVSDTIYGKSRERRLLYGKGRKGYHPILR